MYRIIYEIAGDRHTFWTRRYTIAHEDGLLCGTDVETGQDKTITLTTPLVITDLTGQDNYPPRIEEAIVDD